MKRTNLRSRALRRVLCVCVTALLLIGAQRAVQARANPHLQRGIRLLQRMDDEKALRALMQALKWPSNDRATLSKIHLYRGIAYSSLVHHQGAKQSFTKALTYDVGIQLPSSVSPKIRAQFERLRRQVMEKNRRDTPPNGDRDRAPPRQPQADDDALFSTPTARPRRTPKAEQDRDSSSINWPAWIATGVAAGALAAGIGLGTAVQSEKSEAENSGLTYAEANTILDRARDKALMTNILFGVAGVAAGAAVYFFITNRRPSESRSAAIVPVDGGAIVLLQGPTW